MASRLLLAAGALILLAAAIAVALRSAPTDGSLAFSPAPDSGPLPVQQPIASTSKASSSVEATPIPDASTDHPRVEATSPPEATAITDASVGPPRIDAVDASALVSQGYLSLVATGLPALSADGQVIAYLMDEQIVRCSNPFGGAHVILRRVDNDSATESLPLVDRCTLASSWRSPTTPSQFAARAVKVNERLATFHPFPPDTESTYDVDARGRFEVTFEDLKLLLEQRNRRLSLTVLRGTRPPVVRDVSGWGAPASRCPNDDGVGTHEVFRPISRPIASFDTLRGVALIGLAFEGTSDLCWDPPDEWHAIRLSAGAATR